MWATTTTAEIRTTTRKEFGAIQLTLIKDGSFAVLQSVRKHQMLQRVQVSSFLVSARGSLGYLQTPGAHKKLYQSCHLCFLKESFWILFQILLIRRAWLSIGWGTRLSRGWSSLLLQKGLQGQRQIHRHMARLSKKVLKCKRRNTLKTRMSARNQVDKFGSIFFHRFSSSLLLSSWPLGQPNRPLILFDPGDTGHHSQGVHVNMMCHILDHFSEVPQVPYQPSHTHAQIQKYYKPTDQLTGYLPEILAA